MDLRRHWLWLVVTLALATPGLALEPQRRVSQYNHKSWRSEDGLPQNSVLCATQTLDGYLWFGTYEGLVRFDGAHFTVFDRHNSPELGQSEVHALAEDASGRLWVGTSQGVLRYEDGQLRRPPEEPALAQATIRALATDGKAVWVLSTQGLERIPVLGSGPRQHYALPRKPVERNSQPLAVDRQGHAWVGTEHGLLRVSGDSVEELPLPPELSQKVISLLAAQDGTLWIGTLHELVALREGRFTVYGPQEGMPRTLVTRLLEDRDGSLWVGTERGLLRRTAAGFSELSALKPLEVKQVTGLLEDREGHLWVGTGSDGLHRLSNGPFVPFGSIEGSALDSIRLVLEAQDGTLWLGASGATLARMQDGVITRMGAAQGLENEIVQTMAEGSDGALWIGTSTGAFRYDGQRFLRLGPEQGMPAGTTVWAMASEPGGGMWMATSLGLAWLHEGHVTLYGPEQGVTPEFAMPMIREDSGTLWYGTHSGLVRFAQGAVTRFTTQDGLVSNTVMGLYADPHGTLWVGTNTGISRLKNGKFTSITAAQGLPDETVFTLLLDADDFFWMSSNKGVARVSRRELEEVLDGQRARVNGIFFDERDGMRVGECNGGSQPAGWKTREGLMWFANLRGPVRVDPRDSRLQHSAPEPRIEQVRVQGQEVPLTGRLELAPGQRDLDIRFTAFVSEGAERVPLRYRLEGHDSSWVDAQGRRVATYTSLPPGTYRFQVEALDREGHWGEPGAVLEVELRPWFYQAVWFYALCALGVSGLAAGIYAWRVGQLKQRERWLQARVQERTQALARANSELDANLRTLRDTQAQLVQAGKMAAVGTLAAGVGHEINNPLSYIVSNLEHASEETEALALLMEGPEPVRERLREMQQVLREARMGADRVRRIVRDLKTFSRQDEDTRGPVDLRAVMDAAAKMAAGELRPRAQLVRDYAADVPCVEGNEARLSQVVLNLLINAAHALPEGKPEHNEVRLVLRRGGEGQVVAEVRDTGCGMAPEVLGRIFDPFFTTKPVGVGTGLGLALCHAFVTSMAGRIEVESQVGKGTTFRVLLPAANAPAERAVQAAVVVASSSARGRVLVVDDDPLVSSALRRTLAREHDVEVAVSSRQALELLGASPGGYDVILCDLMMPEMTGMELHAHLMETAPEQARRMVFITGGAYTPAARSFLEQVSNPRVEKPFEPDKLRAQVLEAVKRSRAPRPIHAV